MTHLPDPGATSGYLSDPEDAAFVARRATGGYGTGEATFGLVQNHDDHCTGEGCTCWIADCDTEPCPNEAVFYFVDSADARNRYACLLHTVAVAYDVAVTSTSDPAIPVELHGPDDRRWPSQRSKEADR